MDAEDGHLFIKHLAYYIRTHEKALANSLQLRKQAPKASSSRGGNAQSVRPPLTAQSSATSIRATAPTSTSSSGTGWSIPYFGQSSQSTKPAKLYLTPNQLYYLLCRFDELGVSVGPMNVRLENIHSDFAHSNYVSFLTKVQKPAGRTSDQDSIHSVSSVRSVMSSMSSLLSNLNMSNNSTAKLEKRKAAELEDLKYLYSAFTKIPYLKLAQDHRVRRISGYEEFPFDTAVPIFAFKNVSVLEVVDVDFRSFFGWDRLAEQLHSLTVKRASLDDPTDLLTHIVLDDIDQRRRRSCRTPTSPIQSRPPQTPNAGNLDIGKYFSTPNSPGLEDRRPISESPQTFESPPSGLVPSRGHARMRSKSPGRPPGSSRKGSGSYWRRPRRSSDSSGSSGPHHTPRNSSSNLLALNILPASKWRFLRHLSLADNGLASINGQSLFPVMQTLQSLDLSSNLFTEIPDSLASLVSLSALNLSNCMIESLRSLSRSPLPAIAALNLRANRIDSLAGIEKLFSLERLDLRENALRDPTEVARLTGMPDFHDVYVVRNPFTRTHSNFRVTIFNLFRTTPGYTDDITIDASGPGYSERRQLVDRVPEAPSVPVVRPPAEDEVDGEATTATTRSVPHSPTATSFKAENLPPRTSLDAPTAKSPSTPGEDSATKPFRKRKSVKRRVDISDAGSPVGSTTRTSLDSPHLSFVTAVQSPAHPRPEATPSRPSALTIRKIDNDTAEPPLSAEAPRQSDDSDATAVSPGQLDPAPDLGQSSEMYKRRIEALKRDHGSNWLNALGTGVGDEHAPQDAVTFPGFREKDLVKGFHKGATGSPAVSPPVGGGRRLG